MVEAVEGTPVYVEVGYVDPGYQHYDGQMIVTATGDLAFSPPPFEATGIQLPVTVDQILKRHEYFDGGEQMRIETQKTLESAARTMRDFSVQPIGTMIKSPPKELITTYANMDADLNTALAQIYRDNPSWVEMEFAPVKGVSTQVSYTIAVTPLSVPKHINLADKTIVPRPRLVADLDVIKSPTVSRGT